VIFVQLKLNNFGDNHFSPFVIEKKQWRENKNTCEYEREMIVSKVVKNGYTNIISQINNIGTRLCGCCGFEMRTMS